MSDERLGLTEPWSGQLNASECRRPWAQQRSALPAGDAGPLVFESVLNFEDVCLLTFESILNFEDVLTHLVPPLFELSGVFQITCPQNLLEDSGIQPLLC